MKLTHLVPGTGRSRSPRTWAWWAGNPSPAARRRKAGSRWPPSPPSTSGGRRLWPVWAPSRRIRGWTSRAWLEVKGGCWSLQDSDEGKYEQNVMSLENNSQGFMSFFKEHKVLIVFIKNWCRIVCLTSCKATLGSWCPCWLVALSLNKCGLGVGLF